MCTFTDDGNTAKAIKWHQKQHDPDSTAAAPHRAHLTVLPACTSDMVSLLTWMQIYSASPAFHLAVGVVLLPRQPLPPQRQTRDVINLFTQLCRAHTCPICHVTNALHPKWPRQKGSVVSGRRSEKMGVSVFLFSSFLSLFPSLFFKALFFVLGLGLDFTQEASANLRSISLTHLCSCSTAFPPVVNTCNACVSAQTC